MRIGEKKKELLKGGCVLEDDVRRIEAVLDFNYGEMMSVMSG